MKTALITGINGQDGSYLAELLLNKGYNVWGILKRNSVAENQTARIPENVYKKLNLVYGDMTDIPSLISVIQKSKPDEIYNLAAQSHVRVSFDLPEETTATIAIGTLRILEAIRTLKPDIRFYQASSSEMFGDNPENPQKETTRLMPASPYACAKVYAHNLCRNYRESYKMHISSGILFNHESPRRGETFVTRKITMAAARIKLGLQEKLYLGNLDAKRDWGFAGDYVEAMWLMLQQEKPDDYVIATGKTYSVRQFLNIVFEYAGLSVDEYVDFDERLLRPHEVPLLLGDATKAKEKLNWSYKTDLKSLAIMMYESDLKKIMKENNL